MSIADFISSKCTQTAVYWANPHEDGYGGKTFDAPVEIACRWEDKIQIMGSTAATNVVGFSELSRALVFVTQDVDEGGMLYLGTLDELDSDQAEDPKSIEKAHVIKRFEKTPALGSTTIFLRKAYLTPWLS
jgi:hypothetical protein